MAVPKKKKSKSKRNHRHAVWKGKAALAAQKAMSLGKSVLTVKHKDLYIRLTKRRKVRNNLAKNLV